MTAFRVSLWTFIAAVAIVLLAPLSMLALADRLGPFVAFVVYAHVLLAAPLSLTSVIAGAFAVRRRRIVLLWLIPAAIWLLACLPVLAVFM